jgi:PEP-CTERM motif
VKRSVMKFLLVVAGLACLTSLAAADPFTFTLNGNYNLTGNGNTLENAKITITTTGSGGADLNSGFDIQVVNYQNDPTSIAQILDAMQFNLKNGVSLSNLSLTGASGTLRDLYSSNGKAPYSFKDTAANALGSASNNKIDWGLLKDSSSFTLCAGAYGSSSCPMHPEGVIGGAGANNLYDGGNPSLINTHTPELFGTDQAPVTFHVYSSSVSAATKISDVISGATFTFGTNSCDTVTMNVPKPPTGGGQVPEPASIALLGTGAVALFNRLRRK